MLDQVVWLFVLALPVSCVAWTVTHEEIFREPREWFAEHSRTCVTWWKRKFCYVWTCEYCFSHYIAAAFVALTGFKMLLEDWRGYFIAWLALIAISNVYMSIYSRVRVEIHKEKSITKKVEAETNHVDGPRAEVVTR